MDKKKNKKKKKTGSEDLSPEKGKESSKEKDSFLHKDAKKSITSIILVVLALVLILSLFGKAGIVGEYLDKGLKLSFGWGRFVLPVLMVVLGVVYFRKYQKYRYYLTTIGASVFFVFLLVTFYGFADLEEMKELAKKGSNGGFLGFIIAYPLFKYFGGLAATILSVGFLLIGFILTFNFPLNKFFAKLVDYYRNGLSKVKESALFKKKEEAGEVEEGVEEGDFEEELDQKESNIKEDSISFGDEQEEAEIKKEETTPVFEKENNLPDLNDQKNEKENKKIWKLPSVDLLKKLWRISVLRLLLKDII
jgi:S-DNA-T family DNA segregation ATPase FtsK/SpoIIIE